MKKKILMFLFAVVFVLPIVACAVGCKNSGWKQVSQQDVGYVNLHFDSYDGAALGSIKGGSSTKIYICLSRAFKADTLKIYNNGTEVFWEKDPAFVESDEISGPEQNVGYFTLKNVKSDVKFTFACEEKTIKVNFELWSNELGRKVENEDLSANQKNILSQFRFSANSEHSLYYLGTHDVAYEGKYSSWKQEYEMFGGIPECLYVHMIGPRFGLCQFDTNVIQIDITAANYTSYQARLTNDPTGSSTGVLKENNVIRVNVDNFATNNYNIIINSGSLVSLNIAGHEGQTYVSSNAHSSVTISIDLEKAEQHNINLANAKLKINDTIVSTYAADATTEWKYNFDSYNNYPLTFSNDALSNEKYEYYIIELLDVDMYQAEGLLEVVSDRQMNGIYRKDNSNYVDATSGDTLCLYVDLHFDANENQKLLSINEIDKEGISHYFCIPVLKDSFSQDGSTKRYNLVGGGDECVLQEGEVEGNTKFFDFGYLTQHPDGSAYGNLTIYWTLFEGKLVIAIS